MINRPTIACAIIMKNEAENLPRLFESIQGCFDEIHVADTGSTDNSVDIAKNVGATVHHFEWVDDFSAARNFVFDKCKSEYVFWIDCDDVLSNKEAFILWRDNAMMTCDYWFATYDYASDDQGNPVVSFARERVVKKKGHSWNYFLHEGIIPINGDRIQYAIGWKITHKRTVQDIEKDRSRNLKIFEKKLKEGPLGARMTYYYGKELFENQKPMEAFKVLMDAVTLPELELHDRILGIQYAAYSAMQCNQWDRAAKLVYEGLKLDPTRPEYYTILGDCMLQLGRLKEAAVQFEAAKACHLLHNDGPYKGAIFNMKQASTTYPRNQMSRIYYHLGDIEKAKEEARKCDEAYPNEESKQLLVEFDKVLGAVTPKENLKKVDEIVITTPPTTPYEWDEKIYKEKGMGGSETAAIEMAKWLKTLTGLPVKVFNMRNAPYKSESGVEYLPNSAVAPYFAEFEPRLHIMWRHNIKLSNAPSVLWAHDLMIPMGESIKSYDRLFCLTPFHKKFVMAMQGIKDSDITVTRNGISPEKFENIDTSQKNPNKFVFVSSPDRGLDRCMKVLDIVRKDYPNIELHVFYGFENLYKSGPEMAKKADDMKKMISERPWVHYHGFTEQHKMAKLCADAAIWLHPCDFIETFCITALEMLALGVYPVTRKLGGLMDTLAVAEHMDMATLLPHDCITDEEFQSYADATIRALKEQKWNRVSIDPESFSWRSVAEEWIEIFNLPKPFDYIKSRFLLERTKKEGVECLPDTQPSIPKTMVTHTKPEAMLESRAQ